MQTTRHGASRLATALRRLLGNEAGAGIILIAVAIAAMLLANSPLAGRYHAFFHAPLPWTPIARLYNLHQWINDGLMTIFFFVVGLEIKREAIDGDLSDPARRRLPVIAAAAGMIVPALCYLAIAGTALPLQRGWAIPAATDIAFAVGVIALLGRRVPASLRLFVLTVAIVDDLGAVAIIAVFYTSAVDFGWLSAALVVLGGLIALSRWSRAPSGAYAALAASLWFCVLHSGVHATVAGVAAALMVPIRNNARGDSLLLRFEHALTPWTGYVIVPLFGFANAGVHLVSSAGLAGPLPLAVGAGLFVGKQAGVFLAIVAADRLGIAPRPPGASWQQLWGVAVLCGIGFTMSLFIGGLAFAGEPALYEEAKLGVLSGSLLSGLLGFAVLRFARPVRIATPG